MSKGKNSLSIDDTLPHQISSPSWKDTGIEMKQPFLNKYGVLIGDSFYDSKQSPLNNWSDEIDPSIMSGDEWVHPTNDIGWNTQKNRELIEAFRKPKGVPFMHPEKDVGYNTD